MIEVDAFGLPVVLGDEAVDGDGDVCRFGGMAGLHPCVVVGVAALRPVLGGAAEDAEEHRQAKFDRSDNRFGAAAGAEPDS